MISPVRRIPSETSSNAIGKVALGVPKLPGSVFRLLPWRAMRGWIPLTREGGGCGTSPKFARSSHSRARPPRDRRRGRRGRAGLRHRFLEPRHETVPARRRRRRDPARRRRRGRRCARLCRQGGRRSQPPEGRHRPDAIRAPAETLAFAGVKPGMTVDELFPGGGYFTRMISDVVGPKGKVMGVENAGWKGAAKADQRDDRQPAPAERRSCRSSPSANDAAGEGRPLLDHPELSRPEDRQVRRRRHGRVQQARLRRR